MPTPADVPPPVCMNLSNLLAAITGRKRPLPRSLPPPRVMPPPAVHWGADHPVPVRTLLAGRPGLTLDLTGRLAAVCADIARRCPVLAHVRSAELLVTVTPSRNRSAYGLQARVTPMRFRGGTLTRRVRGHEYQVQRYHVDGREVLYVVTFCVPRFLDQPFEEKLVTIFHELYHIGPAFDGDLRRHGGRYTVHTHSQKQYDAEMLRLVRAYLAAGPDPALLAFLKYDTPELKAAYGRVTGAVVPRPKMLPVRAG